LLHQYKHNFVPLSYSNKPPNNKQQMKVFLLVLLACVVGTLAQANDGVGSIVGAWAGDTSATSNIWHYPVPTNTPCNQAVFNFSYLVFNTTFSTSGTREVVLMAENDYKTSVTVFLYQNAFIPTDSCNSTYLVRQLSNSNFDQAGVLTIDDPVYFAAGTTYFFVVSTNTQTITGQFVLQVWGSVGSGTTTASSLVWVPNFSNATDLCIPYPGINQTFGIIQWTQPTTGNFDLTGIFDVGAAGSAASSMYWTIYSGTFTAAQIAADSCGGTLSSSVRITAHEGDRTAVAWRLALTQNTVYTVAISNTYNGNFGLNVNPTRLNFVQGTSGWNQPDTTTPCVASTNTNTPYYVVPIASSAVTGPFFIVDTEDLPTYLAPTYVAFDTRSFAYQGTVTGTPPSSACPTGTTFLGSADTGVGTGPLVFNTTSGQAYSVVVSDFSGSALTDPASAVYVYAFTGVPVSASTSTGSTTSAATTASSSSTTGAATSGATSGTNATSTSTSSTSTSPASSVAVSAFLLFAGALALLL
jgi:hypothetical protein